MAEQELEKNLDFWLPFIAGIATISAKEVEYMTGKQRSILNAAAMKRIKLFGRGAPNV